MTVPKPTPTSVVPISLFGYDLTDDYDRECIDTINLYLRTLSLADTARRLNISRSTVRRRIKRFWAALERATKSEK